MSIILKGIDLPNKIDLDFHDNHIVLGGVLYPIDIDQLIYIPTPHGRLIDGDEFKSWVDDWYDCTDIGNIVESWIDERPTILEAEE